MRGLGSIVDGVYGAPSVIGTFRPIFDGGGSSFCSFGAIGAEVLCSTANLEIAGALVGGVTPARLSGVNCSIQLPALSCSATVTGSIKVSYTNPASGTNGRLTILDPNTAGNQGLSISGSSCPSTLVPNGTNNLKFGGAVGAGAGVGPSAHVLTTPGPTIS